MYYLIVIMVLCGFFSAFVAARKSRNRIVWWFVGLTILGVALTLAVPEKQVTVRATGGRRARGGARQGRKKPKRCCGSYIPDCFGCPYFRRPLFDPSRAEDKKGHCEFFGRDLIAAQERKNTQVAIEDR